MKIPFFWKLKPCKKVYSTNGSSPLDAVIFTVVKSDYREEVGSKFFWNFGTYNMPNAHSNTCYTTSIFIQLKQ